MRQFAPQLACTIALATACGGGDGSTRDASVDGYFPDAPYIIPTLTSFVPTPAMVTAGTPTAITWNWTYLQDPPSPVPTCTINNGVGVVTRGQMTMVTLTQATTFRLTCANAAGMTARDTVITIPPAAPTLATFTVSPTSVAPNTTTPLTFTWTYTGTPSPAPTCVIDGDVGTASGTPVNVTLPQARTFRMRCTNTLGTSFRDVTVPVNECGTASARCDANAVCTETAEAYTCACNTGASYAGDGTWCGAVNGGSCGANAAVDSGTGACRCALGYVGDGITCTKLRVMFTTSTMGNGALSSWGADANGMAGLAAADAVCAARATAGGLTGTFKAWMSDNTDDAYCRAHNATGKKAGNCNGAVPSPTAGPWVRAAAGVAGALAVAPTIDRLLAPNLVTYYSMNYSEVGDLITSGPVLTGTDENGVATVNNCSNWGSNSNTFRGSVGDILGGSTSWTHNTSSVNDPLCDALTYRLRCVQVGSGSGPALPPRHPQNVKRAFLTSVSGTGNLLSWPDAGPSLNYGVYSTPNAADEICKSRARYGGYANAAAFKGFISGYFYGITSRIVNTGTYNYTRPDGVILGTSRGDLLDSRLAAGWNVTETGSFIAGNVETGNVWTGATATGSYVSSYTCYTSQVYSWTQTSGYSGQVGRYDVLDGRYLQANAFTPFVSCTQTARLYCVED